MMEPEQEKPALKMDKTETVAKVTKRMSKLSVSSSSKKAKVKGCKAKQKAMPVLIYQGCNWPKVVGLEVNEAKRIIAEGKPELYFQILPKNQIRTLAYYSGRVRLIVDKYNRVVETPRVG